jgi:multiple sugar transport system permease protein
MGKMKTHLSRALAREDFFTGLLCLLPSFAVVAVFIIVPIFFSLFLSFHSWDILTPEKPFVGLANYAAMLANPDFWLSLRNTFVFTLGVVPVGALISLGLALLLNRSLIFPGLFRTTFFLPVITSTIAIAIVFLWVYDDNGGLLNNLLRLIGLKPVQWLTSPRTALLSLIIMTVWKNAGYHMIIFLAGLKAIPLDFYETATLAGARPWQKFRYVTWPLLVPTTMFVLVTNTIFTFQVFGPIYVMTGGGPVKSTSVVVYHLYQRAFEFQEMGYASAVAWFIFALLMALTFFQIRLSKMDGFSL